MAMPNSMQTYSQPKYTDCCLPLPPWDAHAGICQEEEIKYKWAWLLNERNFSSNTGHHTRMRLNPEYSHLYIYHLINHFFHEILFPLPPPILTLDFCLNTWSQSCFNVIFRRVKTLSWPFFGAMLFGHVNMVCALRNTQVYIHSKWFQGLGFEISSVLTLRMI